jgi:hypothetical protein
MNVAARRDGRAQMMPRRSLARGAALATSFGALHTVHTLLNLAFTLVQLLVLARGLDSGRYAEVVFLTAIGVYVQPVDQAIGRANYVALSPTGTGTRDGSRDAVVWTLGSQALFLTLVSFAAPLWFGVDDPTRYFGNALYLFGCLFTNFWSFDLQSTVWSADLGRPFAFISILRRLLFFGALALFWATGQFLLFGVATTVIILVFMVVLMRLASRRGSALAERPRRLSGGAILAYLRQFWTSLLSSLSELLILGSPYAVLTFLFGVGPALVAFDSVMKVGRLAMAGTRTFCEITLPRISRRLSSRDLTGVRRGLLAIIAVCLFASAVPAAMLWLYGPFVFSLLLGHNNVVPAEASAAAALIVLTTGLYQPAAFFLSYLNAGKAIRLIAWLAVAGAGFYAIALAWGGAGIVGSLWYYAAIFLALSTVATLQLIGNSTWKPSADA